MPGEQFGPYSLVALLGRGGMGEVHRAIDTRKNRGEVALKRLPAGLATDTEFQRRFFREAELAARLRDPHVIPIHDYGEIEGQPFLDMRLVDGSDLSTSLRRHGPLDPARAVEILDQVAGALDAAHAEGLVHRDVKPQNVLLNRPAHAQARDFVYLIDFGIAANLLTSSVSSSLVSGTAAYMAPERFTAGGDHRVDVYALGAVLHELLTGAAPFRGDFMQLMWAHAHAPPPRPAALRPGLPSGLDTVVGTAMAKDPAARYPSAGALAAAARGVLSGAAPAPVGPPSSQPTWVPSAPVPSAPVPPPRDGDGRVPAAPTPGTSSRGRGSVIVPIVIILVIGVAIAVGFAALTGPLPSY